MKIEYTQVDQDILNFLKVIYFGDVSKPFKAASYRAYRDFNRTLEFNEMEKDKRSELKDNATKILEEEITEIVSKGISTQQDFDSWHKITCERIIKTYKDEKIDFTFGQAQKWLNMTLKYLYVLEYEEISSIFSFCHIPVDRYVINGARRLGIDPINSNPWSTWDNYEEYLKYQNILRSQIKDKDPLRWEFSFWMKEARNYIGK